MARAGERSLAGQFRSFDGGLQIANNVAAEDHKILLKGALYLPH